MYDLIDDALAIGVDDEGWEAEYICIQKKDRNKQCVVKRPAAYGRGSFLLFDKID